MMQSTYRQRAKQNKRMANEFIVAIELGSSKIVGIAGKKNMDGSISVKACVKEDSSSFIRKGVVYNIDKTAQSIANIVAKLSSALKTEIAHVCVGIGGQSIHSVKNIVAKDLPPETVVTQDMVDELQDTNSRASYPDMMILDAVPQEYKVDNQEETDPVGVQCERIEGHYLNICGRKTFYNNLNKCFEKARVNVSDMFLSPLALADSVLTDAEKRSGCVLVDLGAETTTVSVYHKNILRHLVVIPLGGRNITKDIASFRMEEAEAEKMKTEHGRAYTDSTDNDSQLKLPLDDGRQIDGRTFTEIVEGRLQEIIENVQYQIPAAYSDRLMGGIILTGGGSNMRDIEKAFRVYTHIDKVRRANFVTTSIEAKNPLITAHDGTMNTVLGLLLKCKTNCAGNPLNTKPDLFGESGSPASDADGIAPRKPGEPGSGQVPTAAEKQKMEEERRRKEEEQRKEEERQKAEEGARKKERSGMRSLWRKMKEGFDKLLTEDE